MTLSNLINFNLNYPAVAANVQYSDIDRPLTNWNNVPGTRLKFSCSAKNWAFNYPYDPNLPSFYFTPNVNNITMYCNIKG